MHKPVEKHSFVSNCMSVVARLGSGITRDDEAVNDKLAIVREQSVDAFQTTESGCIFDDLAGTWAGVRTVVTI